MGNATEKSLRFNEKWELIYSQGEGEKKLEFQIEPEDIAPQTCIEDIWLWYPRAFGAVAKGLKTDTANDFMIRLSIKSFLISLITSSGPHAKNLSFTDRENTKDIKYVLITYVPKFALPQTVTNFFISILLSEQYIEEYPRKVMLKNLTNLAFYIFITFIGDNLSLSQSGQAKRNALVNKVNPVTNSKLYLTECCSQKKEKKFRVLIKALKSRVRDTQLSDPDPEYLIIVFICGIMYVGGAICLAMPRLRFCGTMLSGGALFLSFIAGYGFKK
jgi:hypothetical protein